MTVMFSGTNSGLYPPEAYKYSELIAKLIATVIVSAWAVPQKATNAKRKSSLLTIAYRVIGGN
jgi:hypothetical protein